jgi:hypothetical protein
MRSGRNMVAILEEILHVPHTKSSEYVRNLKPRGCRGVCKAQRCRLPEVKIRTTGVYLSRRVFQGFSNRLALLKNLVELKLLIVDESDVRKPSSLVKVDPSVNVGECRQIRQNPHGLLMFVVVGDRQVSQMGVLRTLTHSFGILVENVRRQFQDCDCRFFVTWRRSRECDQRTELGAKRSFRR